MKQVVQELHELVAAFAVTFKSSSDADFSFKSSPSKWSKKEVIGHLIDSAQNNLRRFVVGQYEPDPPKIIYDQDFWVHANGYQDMKKEEVIEMWRLVNERICQVLLSMPESNYNKECNTGKTEVQLHSLHWLAEDYVKHMKHHLNQIIPGSFDIIYK